MSSARALSNAAIRFTSRLSVVRVQISVGILGQKAGEAWPPQTRYSDILELSEALIAAFSDLVFLLEERRIADHRLEIFKRAFLAKLYDIRAAFSSELQSELLRCLVLEGPDGSPLPYVPPNEQLVSSLDRRLNELAKHLDDCGAFCEDLIDALQNIHLSKVYGQKLKHRTPVDPTAIALDLDKVDKVEAWIAASAWNLRNEETEARYRISLPQSSRDMTR